jgi:hypothetical protein
VGYETAKLVEHNVCGLKVAARKNGKTTETKNR